MGTNKIPLADCAHFDSTNFVFNLNKQPSAQASFPKEPFKLGKPNTQSHVYRMGHPLAQWVLEKAKNIDTPAAFLTFDLTGYEGNITILNSLKSQTGWLKLISVSVNSFEASDYILIFGYSDTGIPLSEEQAKRLITLPVSFTDENATNLDTGKIDTIKDEYLKTLLQSVSERDNNYLKQETEKLTKWAEDRMNAAELAIKETKARLKELNREAQKTDDPITQLKIQQELQELSRKQKKQRQEIFTVEDEIAEKRDAMIAEIQQRMKQETTITELYTINWKLV